MPPERCFGANVSAPIKKNGRALLDPSRETEVDWICTDRCRTGVRPVTDQKLSRPENSIMRWSPAPITWPKEPPLVPLQVELMTVLG